MSLAARAVTVYREEGFLELLRRSVSKFYRAALRPRLHPYLSRSGYYRENDVKVEEICAPDRLFFYDANAPDTEDGIVSAHENVTRSGDSVVIVGGGNGITAVRAARIVGESGQVMVYEGGEAAVSEIRRVLELNGVSERCAVHHAVVGEERNVYGGETDAAAAIRPADLPECDVLELDCEGSEIDVLRALSRRPRAIVVELHPWNYATEPGELQALLSGRGYEITHRFGHDGTPVSREAFETLLENSRTGGDRYVDSGARWPVVMACIHSG